MRPGALAAAFLAMTLTGTMAGCDLSMKDQPRHDTLQGDQLWADGPSVAPPPDGTVQAGAIVAEPPRPALDLALIRRGQARYQIYCTPCHGQSGRGDGAAVQRGFPAPPDFATDRLRAASAQHIHDVIRDGYGVMYAYGDRVPPRDRWAIVAYIRALQRARADEAEAGA